MTRLLVCSEPDLPSVNMRDCLLRLRDWEDLGSDGAGSFLGCGDTIIMTTPVMHIRDDTLADRARAFGIDPDLMVVMSKHSAASAIPTLTVHPIGNYHGNEHGGRSEALVRSAPGPMSGALRMISSLNDTDEYNVSFEVTHHGPWTDVPTFYIEVGSEETHWSDVHAADILAHVIIENRDDDNVRLIGFGGGHYAPRFTEICLGFKADFGHMLPSYQLKDADDGEVLRMIGDAAAATGTKCVYMHRKSFKKAEERRYSELLESAGYEIVSSKDLDPSGSL
jgi:D-aminoacyl-tRNA deacylase